jgi:hypothetical protein
MNTLNDDVCASAYDYGIYVSRRYQSKIARFHGRRVTVLVIIDDCEEGRSSGIAEG